MLRERVRPGIADKRPGSINIVRDRIGTRTQISGANTPAS
jgi:hypothetical protein